MLVTAGVPEHGHPASSSPSTREPSSSRPTRSRSLPDPTRRMRSSREARGPLPWFHPM